jgi:hypothetical protein
VTARKGPHELMIDLPVSFTSISVILWLFETIRLSDDSHDGSAGASNAVYAADGVPKRGGLGRLVFVRAG